MKIILDLGPHVSEEHCIRKHLKEGYCPFLQQERFGTIWACALWGPLEAEGKDYTGPLVRHSECKKCQHKEDEK